MLYNRFGKLLVKALLLAILLLSACTRKNQNSKVKAPLIVFTHNIHGEFSPCGCRKKPLGGLVQLAGYFHYLKQKYPGRNILYFDTGDTLYPAGKIPDIFKKSHEFSAKQVSLMLKEMGITAMTPGDQDFSLGVNHYKDIIKQYRLPVLLSNASKDFPIKTKKFLKFEAGNIVYYFISVLDSQTLSSSKRKLVINTEKAIQQTLSEIKTDFGQNHPAQQQMTFLLSHSGMSRDQEFAKKFPQLNWIIGAHTQNFTQLPQLTPGTKTKIVQVLSRNHHIGLIDPTSLNSAFETTELNDIFSTFPNNEIWKKKYQKAKDQLEKIKEAELDTIGMDSDQ